MIRHMRRHASTSEKSISHETEPVPEDGDLIATQGTVVVATWGPEVLKVLDYCSITISEVRIEFVCQGDEAIGALHERLFAIAKRRGEATAKAMVEVHWERAREAKALGKAGR